MKEAHKVKEIRARNMQLAKAVRIINRRRVLACSLALLEIGEYSESVS